MTRRLVFAGVVAVAAVIPLWANAYQEEILIQVGMFALLALGLNVVVGLAGLLDLGYVAFWAIGAYTMAILSGVGPVKLTTLNTWEILPIALVVAMFAGVVLGLPVLRLRGDYLAIVTLGFGEIIRITASNLDGVTRGARGISGIPHPHLGSYSFSVHPEPYYYLLLVCVLVAAGVISRLNRSGVGRAWIAIREDEDAAEAMGVHTLRMKLLAFAVGASTASVAGVVQATKINFVSPAAFPVITSFFILSMVVLGGMGSLIGSVVGAAVIVIVPELTRRFDDYRFLAFGIVLVVMMIFRPQGIVPSRRRAAELHGEGISSAEKTGAEVGDAP